MKSFSQNTNVSTCVASFHPVLQSSEPVSMWITLRGYVLSESNPLRSPHARNGTITLFTPTRLL